MTARPIRYQRQVSDRKGKIFYTSITSLSHISKITSDEAFILRTNKYIIKELNLSTLGNVECVTDGLVSSLQKNTKRV